MAQLYDVDENDDGDNFEIPAGLPGSKKKLDPPVFQKAETIKIPRRRGRPPGSTNTKTKPTTNIEAIWSEGAAVVLGVTSTIFAFQIMQNPKYVMTEKEAKSAATGLIYALFQYKQIRDFALATKIDSPWAVALKGFWPYLSRVVLKDIIENVILGFTQSTKPRQSAGRNQNRADESDNVGHNSTNDISQNGNQFPDTIIFQPNWRNDD